MFNSYTQNNDRDKTWEDVRRGLLRKKLSLPDDCSKGDKKYEELSRISLWENENELLLLLLLLTTANFCKESENSRNVSHTHRWPVIPTKEFMLEGAVTDVYVAIFT